MASRPPPLHLSPFATSSSSRSLTSIPFISSSSSSFSRLQPFHFQLSSRRLSLLIPSSPSRPYRSQRVSTAPVEQAPAPEVGFAAEIARLAAVRARLREASSLEDKLRALDDEPRVRVFFGERNGGVLQTLQPYEVYLVKCLVAAGQEHVLGVDLDWGGGAHHYERKAGGGGGRALKEALFTLGDFIEKWSLDGAVCDGKEEMELLKMLLKILGEIELFYDCIGGIIG